MNERAIKVAESRDDYSLHLAHLTRDDRGETGGATAEENFRNMLSIGEITALRPHCMHQKRVAVLDRRQQQSFKVTCFTETPLDQIDKMICGRFEPYGFVFTKEFMMSRRAHPVTYINCYGTEPNRKRGYDQVFEDARRTGFRGEAWKILPFVSIMRDDIDFAWEREWRIAGDLKFQPIDIVCVIVPEDVDADLKRDLDLKGIAAISPGWTVGRTVYELSRQKRRSRWLNKPKLLPKKPLPKKS